MPGRLVSPVTIGRRAELDTASAAIGGALAGKPVHLLVAGEAGVGKSRVAAEIATMARDRGMRVLRGECTAVGDGGLPYGPIVEALRELATTVEPALLPEIVGPAGPDLARLVPALAPTPASVPIQQQWLQARLLEAVLGLLQRLAARSPVLLVLEDLHWADAATRETVSFLIRNLRAQRVLMVLTFRSDELHRRHPLLPWLAEVERTGRVTRVDLARLDRRHIRELVTAILGAEPDAALVDRIHRRSDGNPFFAEELLAVGAGGGHGLSSSLREVLLARIAAAPEEAHPVLSVAAIAGHRIDHDLLAAVMRGTETALLASLRAAVSSQLLVAETGPAGDDGYAFRHALIREVVYDDLLPGERRQLHRACAEAIAARRVPAGASAAAHWAELAHHWASARQDDRAFEASMRAADAAEQAFAFEDALRQYERALELWPEAAVAERLTGADRAEVLARASHAAYLGGLAHRAIGLQRDALAILEPDAPAARLAAMRAKLGRLHWFAGDTAQALEATEAAVAMLEAGAPSRERAMVLAGYGQLLMLLDRYEASRRACEEAIEIAMQVGDREVEGHARNTLGVDLVAQGLCDEGIASIEMALAIAIAAGNADDIGRANVNLGSSLLSAGRAESAAAAIEAGIRDADAIGTTSTYGAFIRLNGILVNFELGRWSRAAAFRDEIDLGQGGPASVRYGLSRIVSLLVARGDTEGARDQLDRLWELLEGTPVEAQFHGPYHAALAELELWEGRPDDALRSAQEGLAQLESSEDTWYRMRLHRIAAWAAADRAEVARARRDAAGEHEAVAAAADLRAAREGLVQGALASRTGPQAEELLAEAATAAAEDGRLAGLADPAAWARVVARWRSRSRPYLVGYARWRQAEALLATGARPAAVEALREADELAAALGAGPLRAAVASVGRRSRIDLGERLASPAPDAQPPIEDPYGLTAREREVLGLVALGRTNRQIAAELFISANTAGVHVSNILGKLGAASRAEAAAIAVKANLAASPVEAEPA